MSIRLHRAMGWGMSANQFRELAGLNADDSYDSVYEYLEKKFEGVTAKRLTYKPDHVYEALKYREGDARFLPIFQRNLLAKEFEPKENARVPVGHADELCTTIYIGDNLSHVLFYPNLYYKKKWHRTNDDIDYAFEVSTEVGCQDEPNLRDYVKILKFGHYPWTNSLMDKEGEPLKWDLYSNLNRRNDWLPAVPTEIRWYLTELEILDNKAVNELRPMAAQYWM